MVENDLIVFLFIAVNTSNEITHVLIMDEVDGMSGNDDRAGVSFESTKVIFSSFVFKIQIDCLRLKLEMRYCIRN